MIVLDTNVVSEPLRSAPSPQVVRWLDEQPLETLFLSTMTVAELRLGVARLPPGKRRDSLHEQVETQILAAFAGRILAFDVSATLPFAQRMAKAKAAGLAISLADGLIAAIAAAHGMAVASRDRAPFEAAGVAVIDPWAA